MSKFTEQDTRQLLSAPGANLDGEQIGCYTVNLGQFIINVAPKLPSDGKEIRFSFKLAVELSNDLVQAAKDAVEKCTGKKLVIPRPGGFLSVIPTLAKLIGINWWD